MSSALSRDGAVRCKGTSCCCNLCHRMKKVYVGRDSFGTDDVVERK